MKKKYLYLIIVIQIIINIYFFITLLILKDDLNTTFKLVQINQDYVEKKF